MFRRPSLLNDISSLRCGGETAPTVSRSSSITTVGSGDYYGGRRGAGGDPADEVTAPTDRSMTPDEISQLSAMLRSTLRLRNSSCAIQADEDATDLVSYAVELVEGGMPVGGVLEELRDMELEICGSDSLDEMRERLAGYLGGLDGNKSDWRSRREQQRLHVDGDGDFDDDGGAQQEGRPRRRNSLQSRLLHSENHVAAMDLSAKTSATKKKLEMEQLFGGKGGGCGRRGGVSSLKDRMAMYDERGSLRSSFQNPDASADLDGICDDFEDGVGGLLNLTKDELHERRNYEIECVLQDATLTEKERTTKIKDVRGRYGVLEMKMKLASSRKSSGVGSAEPSGSNDGRSDGGAISSKDAIPRAERELNPAKGRRSSLDLSAKSVAVKKARELAALKSTSKSVRDRMGSVYNADGSIRGGSCGRDEEDDGGNVAAAAGSPNMGEEAKTNGQLRREELLKVMRDRTLTKEEKARRMEEVRRMYPENEDEAVPLPLAAATSTGKEELMEQPAPDLEGERRRELQSIMRDRTLSKEERKRRLEVVKWKYSPPAHGAPTPAVSASGSDEGDEAPRHPSAPHDATRVTIDLSAKSYAERRRASLQSLEESIGSSSHGSEGGGDGGGERRARTKKVMSVRERTALYASNEFISM